MLTLDTIVNICFGVFIGGATVWLVFLGVMNRVKEKQSHDTKEKLLAILTERRCPVSIADIDKSLRGAELSITTNPNFVCRATVGKVSLLTVLMLAGSLFALAYSSPLAQAFGWTAEQINAVATAFYHLSTIMSFAVIVATFLTISNLDAFQHLKAIALVDRFKSSMSDAEEDN